MSLLLLVQLLQLLALAPAPQGDDQIYDFRRIRGFSVYARTMGNNVFLPLVSKPGTLEIADRLGHIDMPELVRRVGVKPGMTVLEVGAGSGLFTFPLARALEGRGKLYATEVDKGIVGRLAEGAAKENLGVVKPVLVRTRGLDPWYLTKTFDRVFLGSVFQFIADQTGYLRQLRQAVRSDGRLFIFLPVLYPSFSKSRYLDLEAFSEVFASSRKGFPPWDYLSAELAARIRGDTVRTVDLAGFRGLVEALNRMLSDQLFYRKYLHYWNTEVAAFDTGKLIRSLDDRNVKLFRTLHATYGEGEGPQGDTADRREARYALNLMLLTQLFYPEGRAAGYAFERGLFDSQRTITKKMQAAGWEFVAAHRVSHYYDLYEFKPAAGVAHEVSPVRRPARCAAAGSAGRLHSAARAAWLKCGQGS
jgi:cyclopropane fatty-acyl-phospholipid synthase-like methyltransferase